MKLFKTISNIVAFWSVVVVFVMFVYAAARVLLALAGFLRQATETERLKTDIVRR